MSLALKISKILNDQCEGSEYTRWSEADVEDAIKEAEQALAMARPDLAVQVVQVPLKPGSVQDVSEHCSEVVGVLGIPSEDGSIKNVTEESDNQLSKWFNGCETADNPNEYNLQSFKIDDTSSSIIYVSPPVKPGQKASLSVKCSSGCDKKVTCRYEPALIEYAMYRLLSSEDDGSTSNSIANGHFDKFLTLVGASYKMTRALIRDLDNAS